MNVYWVGVAPRRTQTLRKPLHPTRAVNWPVHEAIALEATGTHAEPLPLAVVYHLGGGIRTSCESAGRASSSEWSPKDARRRSRSLRAAALSPLPEATGAAPAPSRSQMESLRPRAREQPSNPLRPSPQSITEDYQHTASSMRPPGPSETSVPSATCAGGSATNQPGGTEANPTQPEAPARRASQAGRRAPHLRGGGAGGPKAPPKLDEEFSRSSPQSPPMPLQSGPDLPNILRAMLRHQRLCFLSVGSQCPHTRRLCEGANVDTESSGNPHRGVGRCHGRGLSRAAESCPPLLVPTPGTIAGAADVVPASSPPNSSSGKSTSNVTLSALALLLASTKGSNRSGSASG